MDYYKTYTEIYDENYTKEQDFVKLELIKHKTKSRGFTFALNNINTILDEKISTNVIKSNILLNELLIYFKKSKSNYAENNTQFSLENETYEQFISLEIDKLPRNYSFKDFTNDLAILSSLNEIKRLFNINYLLFEMMFELNDFKNFEIISYNTVLDNTPIFKKIHKKLYPNYYLKSIEGTGEIKTSQYEDIEFQIAKFTIEEKILLLHVIQINPKKLPLTEFCKLMLITNNINDYRLFIEEPSKNYFYNRVYKGLDTYNSIDKKRELINSVIDKMIFFNLPSVNKALNKIKKDLNR